MRMIFLATLLCLSCCAPSSKVTHDVPSFLLGEFEDDYGIRFLISESEWFQQPNSRYRVVLWKPEEQYLIAQNDSANPSDAGLWTRIDWVALSDMAPFEWAFCMSAYDKPTADSAELVEIAQRDTLMTGCNGYPFSRMKRVKLEDQ